MKYAVCKPVPGTLPEQLRKGLVAHCKDNFPYESCGFVLKDYTVVAVLNVHPHSKHGFKMDEKAQLDTMTKFKGEILGVFHSHPSGHPWPSEEDHKGVIDGLAEDWHYWIVTDPAVFEYTWSMADNGIPALQS